MSFARDATLMAAMAAHFAMSMVAQIATAPRKEVAGIPVNYDEALVGNYALPDALQMENGQKVRNAKTWYKKRRPELSISSKRIKSDKVPGRPLT